MDFAITRGAFRYSYRGLHRFRTLHLPDLRADRERVRVLLSLLFCAKAPPESEENPTG